MVTLVSDRLNHSGVLRDRLACRSTTRAVSLRRPRQRARARRPFPSRVRAAGRDQAARGGLEIDAALFDSVARWSVARASVTGSADELAKMASDLAAQLLETRPTRRAPMWDRAPGLITPSVPAMRAFLAGEKAYVDGHFADAARNYRVAVDADTSFALAYLNLSRAANWMGDYSLESFAIQRAFDHIDRLTTADQLLVQRGTRMAPAARSGRATEPADRHQYRHGGRLVCSPKRFHWGPTFDWTRPEARGAYEHSRTRPDNKRAMPGASGRRGSNVRSVDCRRPRPGAGVDDPHRSSCGAARLASSERRGAARDCRDQPARRQRGARSRHCSPRTQ